jgi:hypothetical protein
MNDSSTNSLYGETYRLLQTLFGGNNYCEPVRYCEADSKAEVKKIFSERVEDEGSEGLVVHSEMPVAYKIKPRVTIDAAVVGFSESSDIKGQVRTLLYALRNADGAYQIIGRTGNGLTMEQKAELYPRLLAMRVSSNYLEIDSNHLAFHIVRPEIVAELSVGDVLAENVSGCIKNPLLDYTDGVFRQTGMCAGYSFVSAVVERLRPDKTVSIRDVRLEQISVRAIPPSGAPASGDQMPESTLVRRSVWVKEKALQKLLVWKTNKDHFNFPAYAASWTTFNPNTADPFKIDMRVSNNENQIIQLAEQFIMKNIKQGWTEA